MLWVGCCIVTRNNCITAHNPHGACGSQMDALALQHQQMRNFSPCRRYRRGMQQTKVSWKRTLVIIVFMGGKAYGSKWICRFIVSRFVVGFSNAVLRYAFPKVLMKTFYRHTSSVCRKVIVLALSGAGHTKTLRSRLCRLWKGDYKFQSLKLKWWW